MRSVVSISSGCFIALVNFIHGISIEMGNVSPLDQLQGIVLNSKRLMLALKMVTSRGAFNDNPLAARYAHSSTPPWATRAIFFPSNCLA
jgi:hypothetical protein